jgi:glycosyltransferase involved in cell wall biosynthesis
MQILLDKKALKRGGPLWIITRLLCHFYDDITLKTYSNQKRGIYLGYNTVPLNVARQPGIRKILLVGGCAMKDNGVPRKEDWKNVKCVVFNSHMSKKVTMTAPIHKSIGKHAVIHILGGAPSDPNLCIPVVNRERSFNKKKIKFMCVAKWWKRPFKRLKQTEILFRKHILEEYPNATLHVGGMKGESKIKGNIHYYQKSFHRDTVVNLYKNCDIQLMFSTFDTGPMTLTESMHYRLPFICSNNCCGKELIDRVDGQCGINVDMDPEIKNFKDCKEIRPMTNKRYRKAPIDYEKIMEIIKIMVDNYDDYTSWKWKENFNYKVQAKRWRDLLKGNKTKKK